MTAAREAIVLPVLFLTVLLLAGLHVGATTALVAPTPYALILGVLLVRVLVRSGALMPGSLMSSSRTALENINGAVVLAAVWVAAAQTIALLIPDSGVPRLALCVFFFILLINTAAAAPDRERLLRSLAVTLGAAFVVKFVVLQTMSSAGESAGKKALLALVDGVTAGVLIQEPLHSIAPYLALVATALFLAGVALLPHGYPLARTQRTENLELETGNYLKTENRTED
jgi:hypothetical protein